MPTKAQPDDPIANLIQWRLLCPIRLWRRDNKVSLRDLAALLDVSLGSVQNWEGGNNTPDTENFAKLTRLTQDVDFTTDFLAWLNDKPKV